MSPAPRTNENTSRARTTSWLLGRMDELAHQPGPELHRARLPVIAMVGREVALCARSRRAARACRLRRRARTCTTRVSLTALLAASALLASAASTASAALTGAT